MVRPMPVGLPRLRPGQCPACRVLFGPDTAVIRTRSNTVLCQTHDDLVVAAHIIEAGPWSAVRHSR